MPHDKRPREFPFELTLHKVPDPSASDERSDEAFGYRAGQVIEAKYELVALLEKGGMAATWVVHNLVLDAQFALKLLGNDGGEHHAAERMLREARDAAAVEHPALIRVFDFGVTMRGDPFVVTELIRGSTIKQLVAERGRIPPLEAVRLLLPIADALAVAHLHGVVHGNISAHNIVCVQDDTGGMQPKIVDFGTDKSLERDWERITMGRAVNAGFEYFSPEQAGSASKLDHRTDIWSFAVVLYELLTGRTPFLRADVTAIVPAILHDPVPPLRQVGVGEDELSALVLRGLHKLPEARWVDMRSCGRALAQWLVEHGVDHDVGGQSVRSVWFAGSSSAPPVEIDNFANERFAGFDDAYDVPKRSIFRTGAGSAAAAITVSGIVVAGLFASGAFDETAPSFPRAENGDSPASTSPLAAATGARFDDEPAEDSEDPLSDAMDGGVVTDAGVPDAALVGVHAVAPNGAWTQPRGGTWSPPPWRIAPARSEAVLPSVEPPPDLSPAVVPYEVDDNEANDVDEDGLDDSYEDPSD